MKSMLNLFRVTVLGVVAVAFLQGCSLDLPSPTAWLGSDDDTKTKDGEFPSLSEVPERPETPTSQAEKRESAESLAADGKNANYTSETLRGDSFTPAFAPQPASSVLDAASDATQQSDEPTADSDEADDQRSELPAANRNAALAPAPQPQPLVPVRIEEVPEHDAPVRAKPVPAKQMVQPATVSETAPAQESRSTPRQQRPPVTLSGSTYTSKFAASAGREDELQEREASFAQSSWTEEADVLSVRPLARIDLLIDDASSESRNEVFQDQLAGNAVITGVANQLAAFAPAAGPDKLGGNSGTQVASAGATQRDGSPALGRGGDRRYTATLLQERIRAGRQLVADQGVPDASSEGEAIVLARTNASGFTLSASDTLEASTAMAASVARADVKAASDDRDSVPPFKTLTFARAEAPDLSEVDVAARMADAVIKPVSARALQVAKAEPPSVETKPAIAEQPEAAPVQDLKEEVQPPEITLFFANGTVQIEESDEPDLERIADVQRQKGGAVRVVTHVSSLPEDQGSQLSLQASLERARAVSKRMMKLGVHPTAVVVETRFDEDETAERVAQNANPDLRVEVFLE